MSPSDPGRPPLAEQLSAARRRRGLSVRALAAASGLPASTIQGWLSGAHLPGPGLRREFTALLEALGLTEERPAGQWWADVARARTPAQPATTPYVGLRAYRPEDEAHFFGRTAEVAELGERVLALAGDPGPRLLAVVGASGAGKSSLLGAGLLGRLRAPGGPLHGWTAAATTPGRDPEGRLDRALDQDPRLLVVDQLEELWTDSQDPQRPGRVLDRLAGAARDRVVVVGLRADFYGRASRHAGLRAALERPVLLGALDREQLRRIVVGPAEAVGARVSPDLVEVILRDVAPRGTGPDVGLLPMLSQALLSTWEHARSRELTVADYHAAGGITEAVDRRAEEVLAGLGPDGQEAARAVFLGLVRIVGEGSARSTVVRTPVPRDQLPEGGEAVVEHFARARLLTLDRDEVQLAHEALLEHWARLRRWIEDSRRDLYVRQQLQRATRMWLANDRDPLALIPLGQLASFRDWTGDPRQQALLSPAEREYLEESERHYDDALERERRSARQIERSGRIGLVLLALAMCAAVVAGALFLRAENFQHLAETARDEALSRQTALEASRIRAESPNLAAQLGLLATRLAPTREGASALLDSTAVAVPERLLGPEGASRLAALDDGSVLARAAEDGTLSVWRGAGRLAEDREELAVVEGRPGLRDVDLVRQGERVLAAVGGEGHLSLWDVTQAPARRLAALEVGAGTPVEAVVLSPDGEQLLAGGAGQVLRFAVEDPRAPVRLPPLELAGDGSVPALAAGADGTVYAAGPGEAVERFATGGDGVRRLEPLPTGRPVLSLDVDADRLAAGLAAREVRLFTLEEDGRAEPAGSLDGFDSWVSDVDLVPGGERIVSASYDQRAYVHRLPDRTRVEVYPTPARVTSAVGRGDTVVTASQDGATRAWDRHGPVVHRRDEPVYQLSADEDDTLLSVVGIGEDVITLLDLTGHRPRELPAPRAPEGERLWFAGALAPDASFLVGGTEDGDVLVWPLREGRPGEPVRVPAVDAGVTGARTTQGGTTIVVWSEVGTRIALLERESSGAVRRTAELPVAGTEAAGFSASGRVLATADGTGDVVLWDLTGPEPRRAATLELDSIVTALAFAPSGERVAVGTERGGVELWDLADPDAPRRESSSADALSSVKGLRFSPDGEVLAGAAADRYVWLWRPGRDEGLEVVGALSASGDRMNDVEFLGDRLLATGDDGAVRGWLFGVQRAAEHICATRGDPITDEEWRRHVPGADPRALC
ncbi:hypothetical protein AUQ48_07925 [Kocuria flava]|uniref:HTH cro/C1-type domain-containing protein n=1 Tax=Kocuria flava TaxID=446860 RepID=A0A2N4T1Y2_9MICC|nr:helix-turn-helix domain-containing protein [Kocuria flava]PLC12176.1 hypothetical protein AUQ48_07925 [Kocuria flava]